MNEDQFNHSIDSVPSAVAIVLENMLSEIDLLRMEVYGLRRSNDNLANLLADKMESESNG